MDVIKVLLAFGFIAFLFAGLMPPAKPLDTAVGNPFLYGVTLLLSGAIALGGLLLPPPLRGLALMVGTFMGWSVITHFALKINYSKNTLAGFAAAIAWVVVVMPIVYLVDPAAFSMFLSFLGMFWSMAMFVADAILKMLGK